MSSPTELHLPPTLPYPIKIASLDVKQSAFIQRGTRLLSYSFKYQPPSPGARPEIRFGTWDCPLEGTVEAWNCSCRRRDLSPEVEAQDRHHYPRTLQTWRPSRWLMWALRKGHDCVSSPHSYDYTGFSDASRASIQMTHSAFGPTVSMEEAQRIENETAEHLLKSRRLSLIVDLDQTIVHATVDPTVGEWITEGEAWEARQLKKSTGTPKEDGSDSSDSETPEADVCNPNWDALKDVRKFRLGPESFGLPSRGAPKVKGKHKAIESEGCMYYIKPRPGLLDFLHKLSTKYEMHVYTMGTRAYAEEGLTQKSLQRLFPCDTSMVVIIDDRADVWEWSPNLIKVIPYDFFVGIGDINSAFLPKVEPLAPTVHTPTLDKATTPPAPSAPTEPAPSSPPLTQPEECEDAEVESKALLTQNSLALEAQVEERPLAKKQEELQDTEHTIASTGDVKAEHPRKALLKNDDVELRRVGVLLQDVHRQFFDAYDRYSSEEKNKRRKLGNEQRLPKVNDVTRIIPEMRTKTLNGVHIVFSSVIPLDTKPENTEIWKVAQMFGARCYTELNNLTTHVVAAKQGTVKVDMARKRGGIKIVWLAWFTDSIALWRRQDETPYLLEDPTRHAPSLSPSIDPHPISSDPEPDADDWDVEPAPSGNTALELGDIDWNNINDEVDAAMNESDDEDEDLKSERSVRSAMASEDDGMTDETRSQPSPNSSPRLKRKRLRSITPSENGNPDAQQDALRSPLSKRKKFVSNRTGTSKLKEAFTADEIATSRQSRSRSRSRSVSMEFRVASLPSPIDEEEEEEEEEEDFLARELGEDWG
ncbi:hypothetical protein EV363DRAFT_1501642 [Boletus edulis]|nr:hypothetical protein EV363DRAFT_1501642 [Boletus edulis]